MRVPSAREVRKKMKSLTRPRGNGRTKAVLAGGAALLGAAGVATAWTLRRRRQSSNGTTYHVGPNGEGWTITLGKDERPLETFETKREAVDAARKIAKAASPSELVIHGSNGSRTASHRYAAG